MTDTVAALNTDLKAMFALATSLGIAPERANEIFKVCQEIADFKVNTEASPEDQFAAYDANLQLVMDCTPPREAALLGVMIVQTFKQFYLGFHANDKLDPADTEEASYTPQGNENWLGKGENRDVT